MWAIVICNSRMHARCNRNRTRAVDTGVLLVADWQRGFFKLQKICQFQISIFLIKTATSDYCTCAGKKAPIINTPFKTGEKLNGKCHSPAVLFKTMKQ